MSEAPEVEIDWDAVTAAISVHIATGVRSPLMAQASRLDPRGYARANARAMEPVRKAAERRQIEQGRAAVARRNEAAAAFAKAQEKREAALSASIDARLRALGLAPVPTP